MKNLMKFMAAAALLTGCGPSEIEKRDAARMAEMEKIDSLNTVYAPDIKIMKHNLDSTGHALESSENTLEWPQVDSQKNNVLPVLLANFKATHPEVTIQVSDFNSDKLLELSVGGTKFKQLEF